MTTKHQPIINHMSHAHHKAFYNISKKTPITIQEQYLTACFKNEWTNHSTIIKQSLNYNSKQLNLHELTTWWFVILITPRGPRFCLQPMVSSRAPKPCSSRDPTRFELQAVLISWISSVAFWISTWNEYNRFKYLMNTIIIHQHSVGYYRFRMI